MDNVSVGDFAAQILAQDVQKESSDTPLTATLHSTPAFYSPTIGQQAPDISQVVVPNNFVNNICEGKDEEERPTIISETVLPSETTLEEANPVAEKAIDIILEGLRSMLETVKETLQEVKQFVNENSLTNEMTGTGSGSIGVNQAGPPQNKEDKKKEDKMRNLINQMRGNRKSKK